MHTEGGKFLLSGPDYIKSFINLKSFENSFDKEDKDLHKLLLSRAQKVRDIFIRGAMKYLEDKKQDTEMSNIQKTMQRLAKTSKVWWMINADKYLNKEIK
jgi:transcriptional regulator of heat shock response